MTRLHAITGWCLLSGLLIVGFGCGGAETEQQSLEQVCRDFVSTCPGGISSGISCVQPEDRSLSDAQIDQNRKHFACAKSVCQQNTGANTSSTRTAISNQCPGRAGRKDQEEPTCKLSVPSPDEEPYETLSEYCFFGGNPADQLKPPARRVVPYSVRAKLYSDESDKFRFVVLPEGETIGFNENDLWAFPEGSIIVKTFYFPHDATHPEEGRRLLETRLLMRRGGKWEPQVYLWNEEQTEATRHLIGRDVQVEWIDEDGEESELNYRVPNVNKCQSCHSDDGEMALLGPRTRQLNRTFDYQDGPNNQIEQFVNRDLLDSEPPATGQLPKLPSPKNKQKSVSKRAKAYLEANCAHCHNPTGGASNSGLFLQYQQDDPQKRGICKQPVAAGPGTGGNQYDIKPGYPEQSIMVFRMNSNEPGVKMPELPLRTIDTFGVDLIRRWISDMEPTGCQNRQ